MLRVQITEPKIPLFKERDSTEESIALIFDRERLQKSQPRKFEAGLLMIMIILNYRSAWQNSTFFNYNNTIFNGIKLVVAIF